MATATEPADSYLELAELAGGFIHEIKNHLSTLSLNVQLIAEEFETPENQKERRVADRLAKLSEECRRLVELSNDFLRFARIDRPETVPSDFGELVGRMVDFIAPTAKAGGIELNWYPAPDLPTVAIDVEMIEKVILNLLLNAEDAMPEGGSLTLQSRREGDHVALDIIDTGPGIPASVLPRLFKPFVTTKENGNGLGLATSRKIVRAHGGEITVQSEPGRGTKFTVTLPMARSDHATMG